jgi:integrase
VHGEAACCFPHASRDAEVFRLKLNNRTVRALTLPAGENDRIVFDDDLGGFGYRLRRSPGGGLSRTWVCQYRAHGRTRRITIASNELLDADQARAQAKRILGAVALGRDPQAERESARLKQVHTLKSVAETYLEDRKHELRPASYRVTKLYLGGKAYFGPLHNTPISEIRRADVAARISAVKRNSGMVTASRARSALSTLFVWAMGEGLAEANPVIGTNQPDTSEPRDRVLTSEELVAIWKASGDGEYGKIVKLLMLLCSRRQEIGGMKWSEINREKCEWTLPKERAKNKRELTLPLPPAAISIIESVPQIVSRDRGGASTDRILRLDLEQGRTRPAPRRLGEALANSRCSEIGRDAPSRRLERAAACDRVHPRPLWWIPPRHGTGLQ